MVVRPHSKELGSTSWCDKIIANPRRVKRGGGVKTRLFLRFRIFLGYLALTLLKGILVISRVLFFHRILWIDIAFLHIILS